MIGKKKDTFKVIIYNARLETGMKTQSPLYPVQNNRKKQTTITSFDNRSAGFVCFLLMKQLFCDVIRLSAGFCLYHKTL